MKDILNIIPVVLYGLVGVVSLVMAYKNLHSERFLPFVEKAAGKQWVEVEELEKIIILFLMRITGMGFVVVSVLLVVFPTVNYFYPNIFYKYAIPLLALIYCTGLFLFSYRLHKITGTDTPWKKSMFAIGVLLIGMIVSMIS
jgi:hypothetical protein